MDLDHLGGRARHILAPEIVDEAVDGHGVVGVEQQPSQESALARRSKRDRRSAVSHVQRPEQARFHRGDRGYQLLPPSGRQITGQR